MVRGVRSEKCRLTPTFRPGSNSSNPWEPTLPKAICDKKGEKYPVSLVEGQIYEVRESVVPDRDYWVVMMPNGRTQYWPKEYFRAVEEHAD